MKAVIQRVKYAKLTVDNQLVSEIKNGLLVFVGIANSDTFEMAKKMADKIIKLRIFSDLNDKMNLDIKSINGEILLVSNFTLFAVTKGTNRPSFSLAGNKDIAQDLYNKMFHYMNEHVPTKCGLFGADMQIATQLDGPVTIHLEY